MALSTLWKGGNRNPRVLCTLVTSRCTDQGTDWLSERKKFPSLALNTCSYCTLRQPRAVGPAGLKLLHTPLDNCSHYPFMLTSQKQLKSPISFIAFDQAGSGRKNFWTKWLCAYAVGVLGLAAAGSYVSSESNLPIDHDSLKSTWLRAVSSRATVRGLSAAAAERIPDDENHYGSGRPPSMADIIERVSPAVVNIQYDFSHGFHQGRAGGSGFIVRSDGLMLTNEHVVSGRREVTVALSDEREYRAHVIASDPKADLAVLKIQRSRGDTQPLPIMKLGDSNRCRAGDWVIALGSPLFLSQTATAGIISSPKRPLESKSGATINYIQTDAVVIVGNSGGPLVNMAGEAIGVNNMMMTTGISFAIPSSYASAFLDQVYKRLDGLKEGDKRTAGGSGSWLGSFFTPAGESSLPVQSKYLGLQMITLTEELIYEFMFHDPTFAQSGVTHGVFINHVVDKSPAHLAGLQRGDVIVSINDKPIRSAKEVYSATQQGGNLRVTVLRRGQRVNVDVTPVDI